MQAPAFFQGQIHTLEDIVATLNDGGSAMSTPAEIAGWYIFDAARDGAGRPVSELDADDFDAHLDFLVEAGAEIEDREAALAQAAQHQAAAVAEEATD